MLGEGGRIREFRKYVWRDGMTSCLMIHTLEVAAMQMVESNLTKETADTFYNMLFFFFVIINLFHFLFFLINYILLAYICFLTISAEAAPGSQFVSEESSILFMKQKARRLVSI